MTAQHPSRVGWVVDVQNDFMEPTGRLYVHDLFDAGDPGAIEATPAIERAVKWMRAHCDVTVFTGDWHAYGDREIDPVSPDARRGTYPPHCMGLSPVEAEQRGAQLLDSVSPGEDALVLPREAQPTDGTQIAQRALRERQPVFLQKNEFSAFEGNAATDAFVRSLAEELGGAPEFIVCGVATDVCVKHAVDGLLDRGQRVRVIPEATHSLGLLGPAETLDRWAQRGAVLTSVDDLAPDE